MTTITQLSDERRHRQDVSGAPLLTASCPLCECATPMYLFARHGARILRCTNCGLTRLEPPSGLTAPVRGGDVPGPLDTAASITEERAAEAYIRILERRKAAKAGVLLVAADGHPFMAAAAKHGFSIRRRLEMRELERLGALSGIDGPYETAVILLQLEKAANPVKALEKIQRSLAPGAVLLIVAPSLDSWPARMLRSQWTEWRRENLYYFDTQTIQSACLRTGFAELEFARDRRAYTLQHIHHRALTSPRTLLTRAVCGAASLVPRSWRRRFFLKLPTSGVVLTARRVEPLSRPLLSIVMPVYNERATFEQTLTAVLAKRCPGVDKEIIIVESQSTDGTREVVRKYEGHPEVTVIYQDRPRGKGAAVREGLKHARGTMILIQDADTEYDVEDYDALLEPLLTFRRAFVLGSRHTGTWKMRRFSEQTGVSTVFNFGHVFFGGAMNILYGQRMKDPFTMYKVFRRDCLHRLKLECNRFDFDFELVIKLVRKGYVPLEIPVNYCSRSFGEGKKVSLWRDPIMFVRALVKYRFASIYDS